MIGIYTHPATLFQPALKSEMLHSIVKLTADWKSEDRFSYQRVWFKICGEYGHLPAENLFSHL